MADTTFTDKSTVIEADWANDVNDVAYTDCGGVGGLSSVSIGKGASLVGIEDAGGIYTSVTVEGALQEFTSPIKDKASPGNIGTTTPGTGTFTTLTANTAAVVPDGSANTHAVNVGQIQEAAIFSAGAGGTADAITAAITPAPTAWTDGQLFLVRGCSNNLTTTPTFTPNSGTLAAKTLVKYGNQTLDPYDLNGDHWFRYDSVNDVCEVVNPSNREIDLSSASSDIVLGVGKTAVYSVSAVASKALHITVANGQQYRVNYNLEGTTNGGILLNVNNTTYAATFNNVTFYGNGTSALSSSLSTSGFLVGVDRYSSGECFIHVDNSSVSYSRIISSYTHYDGTSTIVGSISSSFASTTAWTSLGTLVFPASRTGSVSLTRLK